MRPAPNVVQVVLGGELDLSSVRLLDASLREVEDDLLEPSNGDGAGRTGILKMVALDLSKLEFIDSAGLTSLVQAQWRVESRGGRVALLGAPERVKRLFSLTGLDHRFHFMDASDLDRAVRTAADAE
ncbi:MAG TPA: STAS domain-containing protein [Actinomycetota bacterium]|nr:STAS domain-containing protein [Actinomycetota bacterium]